MKNARCFAIADAGYGEASAGLAVRIARWIGARGGQVLVGDGTARAAKQGARDRIALAPHLGRLAPSALRGFLGSNEGCFGILACDGGEGTEIFDALADVYELILMAFGDRLSTTVPAFLERVPVLVLAEFFQDKGISLAGRFIDRLQSTERAPRPIAFTLEGGETDAAATIARRWHLPFWGFAGGEGHLAERILERAQAVSLTVPAADATLVQEVLVHLRQERQLVEMEGASGDPSARERLRREVALAARRLLPEIAPEGRAPMDEEAVVARVVDEAVGLGPLEALLADSDVTEIMVNGVERIYLERRGRIERAPVKFAGGAQLLAVIERMVAEAGRRIDELSPMVDARLPDGSRVNVVIPPLAVDGPAITIRKFVRRLRTLDDAVASGMLSPAAAAFLAACVHARITLLISGGTGAGKTTLLGILAGAIDHGERIVTIEDAAELSLAAAHVVRLEARPPGIEGSGAVSIRDLVRNALRMRPDRIIVGECRGPEALDMLQAMNTGHEGSLTTIHANAPRDALARLETMVLMAGVELPLSAVREQIVRAIDAIVQVARAADGARRIVEIAEVTGLEGMTPCLQTLAADGDGRGLAATGIAPRFAERLRARGIELPPLARFTGDAR